MTMLNPVISNYLIGGMEPKRLGNISPTYQGSGDTWATKDGYLQMTVITDTMAKKMCAAFDRPELMDDPRFATDKGRVDHREAVRAEIGAILNTETTAVWMQRLGAAGVPVGPVHDMGELMDFPQLEHRGILMTLPAPQGMQGEITVPGAGFHASGGEPSGKTAGPVLGQHTDEVLGELGYDAAAIQAFRDDGII